MSKSLRSVDHADPREEVVVHRRAGRGFSLCFGAGDCGHRRLPGATRILFMGGSGPMHLVGIHSRGRLSPRELSWWRRVPWVPFGFAQGRPSPGKRRPLQDDNHHDSEIFCRSQSGLRFGAYSGCTGVGRCGPGARAFLTSGESTPPNLTRRLDYEPEQRCRQGSGHPGG
jgi:hypothetical protein